MSSSSSSSVSAASASGILVLATRNKGKVREIGDALRRFGFDVQPMPDDFPEIEETGTTFEENALIKAHAVAEVMPVPVLAEDSGLEVDALKGAPGVYSARYSQDMESLPGESVDERNNRKLLTELEGVPQPRTARFHCCMALVRPEREDLVIHGTWEGEIAEELHGSNGFGYDPLFFDPELGRISATLTREEKNARSHRGKALRKLLAVLEEEASAAK